MNKVVSLFLVLTLMLTSLPALARTEDTAELSAQLTDYTCKGLTVQQLFDAAEDIPYVLPATLLLDYFMHTSDGVWFEFCAQGCILRRFEDRVEAFYTNGKGSLLHIVYAPTTQEASYAISTGSASSDLAAYVNGLPAEGLVSDHVILQLDLVACIDDVMNYFLDS